VTNTLASLLLLLLLLVLSGHVTFLSIVLLLFLAQLIGPAAGMFVQKYMTTAVDVERLEIAGIEIRGNRVVHSMRMRFVLPEELFIATRQRGDVREPRSCSDAGCRGGASRLGRSRERRFRVGKTRAVTADVVGTERTLATTLVYEALRRKTLWEHLLENL
jgi:hypothetical protein